MTGHLVNALHCIYPLTSVLYDTYAISHNSPLIRMPPLDRFGVQCCANRDRQSRAHFI